MQLIKTSVVVSHFEVWKLFPKWSELKNQFITMRTWPMKPIFLFTLPILFGIQSSITAWHVTSMKRNFKLVRIGPDSVRSSIAARGMTELRHFSKWDSGLPRDHWIALSTIWAQLEDSVIRDTRARFWFPSSNNSGNSESAYHSKSW